MVNPMESTDEIPQEYKIPIQPLNTNHSCVTNKTEQISCGCSKETSEQKTDSNDNDENVVTAYDVEEALKDVIDPELGINIVDLGLVYGITLEETGKATIDMTLTSPACPLTDVIETQTKYILSTLVEEVEINWVWLPPWGPEQITEDGKDQLRALGFNL